MFKNIKIKNRILTLVLSIILVLSLVLSGCNTEDTSDTTTQSSGQTTATSAAIETIINSNEVEVVTLAYEYDEESAQSDYDESDISTAVFSDEGITFNGSGAYVTDNVLTIIDQGVYSLSGSIDDGQVVVDTEVDGIVYIVLDNISITCSDSAPINIVNADETVITIKEGTTNYLEDGETYVYPDEETDEPNATIFSKDDLTINGTGTLNIIGNYKHGINSKDDLIILSGNINITAEGDGMRGKDKVVIADGNIVIDANSDGIQSSNSEDPEKGFIQIDDGSITITAENDGIQAATNIIINGGDIDITTGGGSVNIVTGEQIDEQTKAANIEYDESSKGIKADSYINITAGNINISSYDDAIHSDNVILISGGNIVISSDDDGIHSDYQLTIDDGVIDIQNCNEGIESAVVTINGGDINVNASDDGINVSDSTLEIDSTQMGQVADSAYTSANCAIIINGGYTVVNSSGDSLDSNGLIYMTGGVLIANGPLSTTNGAIDYDISFNIEGGILVAVGSSGMAEAPSDTSSQYSVLYIYDTLQEAGTMIYVESEDGEQILAYSPLRDYQSVVISTPDLEDGASYTIYSGGSMDSNEEEGLYEDGNYTKGDVVDEFEISEMTTIIGTQSQMGGRTGIQIPGGVPSGVQTPGRP